ncbi:MAG: hypothetical protein BGO43_03955 [Gammaproteobacteria bacterium 39-13]|nr:MAG: hypothetical protein BGO43_03955 [Gammaproteobacteria bacterium 39-13]
MRISVVMTYLILIFILMNIVYFTFKNAVNYVKYHVCTLYREIHFLTLGNEHSYKNQASKTCSVWRMGWILVVELVNDYTNA